MAAVKICGIKTQAALYAALEGGADYVGLVFFPRSPRHVDAPAAKALAARARGRAKIVALTVDPDDAALEAICAAAKPDILQLHGAESPDRVREIAARFETPVLKAIKIAAAADVAAMRPYLGIAEILFDAKPPQSTNALPGGNGEPFDWRVLSGAAKTTPFMLSGGLTPGNVTDAIRITGAAAVDVSSGVEDRPGEKSIELIRRFLLAAKAAKEAA